MAPRTVLHITPSSRLLGARRSLLQLVTNLDPARYRPIVAAQGPGALVDALRATGIEVRMLPLGWWRKGRDMLLRPLRIWQLARLARQTNAHLIHCNEFHSNPYAVRAAGALPVVTHMRLSITPKQIRTYDLARARRVICVSHAAARDFDQWPESLRRQRLQVVYNGVDCAEFSPRLGRAEARRRLGLSDTDFVAGQFALVSPRKQQLLLLQAAAQLADALPRLRILIVGSPGKSDEPYAREIHRIAEAPPLAGRVRCIDFTPDVVPLYEACDINILISNDEGFGRTPIEAGALGIPSIGARVGGIPEVIAHEETGLLIPGDDNGAALAHALQTLGADPDRLAAMGHAARRRAQNTFGIARHAQRMMDLFDEVLDETAPGE